MASERMSIQHVTIPLAVPSCVEFTSDGLERAKQAIIEWVADGIPRTIGDELVQRAVRDGYELERKGAADAD